jgi:hypothetical protein
MAGLDPERSYREWRELTAAGVPVHPREGDLRRRERDLELEREHERERRRAKRHRRRERARSRTAGSRGAT